MAFPKICFKLPCVSFVMASFAVRLCRDRDGYLLVPEGFHCRFEFVSEVGLGKWEASKQLIPLCLMAMSARKDDLGSLQSLLVVGR